MISFIVPAYNEEALIGRTLEAIDRAGRCAGEPYEIVVADDVHLQVGRGWNVVVAAHVRRTSRNPPPGRYSGTFAADQGLSAPPSGRTADLPRAGRRRPRGAPRRR